VGSSTKQGRLWGARAQDYAELQEGVFLPLFEEVAQMVITAPGIDLLDIGCGSGIFCQIAAGSGARVSGLDASESMLNIARQRVPQGDFRVGEMEALPYDDRTFDVATAFNSLQFAAQPVNALREARRTVRPKGKVVVGVFGRQDETESAAVFAAVGALLPRSPSSAEPVSLSAEGAMEALIAEAGLTLEHVGEVDSLWDYPDEQTAMRGFLSSGNTYRVIQEVGETRVRQAIARALVPFRTSSGRYQLKNKARYLLAS
jgi:2-polyprenyl-3-methyl-5-hydroxy-6-metoxy-1,4-benzoquinol methylase